MSQAGTGPMDQFVDWDQAAAPIGGCADFQLGALGNVYEENAGFSDLPPCLGWGDAGFPLFPPLDSAVPDPDLADEVCFETPEAACTHCAAGGFSCRIIRQGGSSHVDGCTSCVALQFQCSLVGAAPAGAAVLDAQPDASFPSNHWPAIDEYPDTVPSCQSQFAYPPGTLAESDSVPTETTSGDLLPGPSSSVAAPPKIGARFSRESVRVLKNWLSAHPKHPYPSEEEKDALQWQTGLSKTQISNWLANARRRGKVQAPRSVSPGLRDWSSSSSSLGAMEIPQRRATPALEAMNPLQRWQVSPPEHEPASVSAIARAVTASSVFGSSSGLDSPYSFNYTDDSSGRSICRESTASSVGTSRSSNISLGSAYSHTSRNSWGSFGSMPFNSHGRRRRRRKAATRPEDGTNSAAPLKTFQCTFCTETFRTKHDWQRHEKSLHLSLERWVCAPDGPRAVNPETGLVSCVFCGGANPDDAHIDSHNHSACLERTKEERTFYRKDHLNQHLRLVHNVKFLDWAMKSWKIATPEIRSRCGFCGIIMDSWTIRVDHLAEHFKTGYSMADWKGGWGFEVPVLDMVENSIPPSMRPPAHLVDQNSTPSSWQ